MKMLTKINLCFVGPVSDNAGGIAIWLKNISTFCANNNIHYNIIDTLPKRSKQIKRNFFNRFVKTFFRIFFQLRKLRKNISHNHSTILHIATSGSFGFYRDYKLLRCAKKRGLKTVMHLHFGRTYEILKSKKGIEYRLFKKCSKYTDSFVAIDKITYNALKGFGKTFFVRNPVEQHCYTFNPKNKRFIFVGRCTKEKGFNELIKAFSLLTTTQLDIVGEYKNDTYQKFKKMQNIKFYGQLPHTSVLELISQSSCLILPSYTEGMPNVILEAMSYGVPCIGSKVGNIPEMISNCGLLINPGSVDEVKKAIIEMSDDSFRTKCSLKSYKTALEDYSLEVVGHELLNVWHSLD